VKVSSFVFKFDTQRCSIDGRLAILLALPTRIKLPRNYISSVPQSFPLITIRNGARKFVFPALIATGQSDCINRFPKTNHTATVALFHRLFNLLDDVADVEESADAIRKKKKKKKQKIKEEKKTERQ